MKRENMPFRRWCISGKGARLTLVVLLASLTSATMLAHGSIGGRVLDSTGAALPGVAVEVTSVDVGKTESTTSDSTGQYWIPLRPGRYDVSFRLINFATSVRKNVAVGDGAVEVDAMMLLSSSAEVVVAGRRTFRNLAELDGTAGDLIGFADSGTVGVVSAAEIARQPYQRPGEVLETVPGLIISQHSGEGKGNQYYLRGFNLDHGTDLAINVAGLPVNMPTHGHGQGYADSNFVIPELISAVQYKKGPYFADEGDFATAGAVNVNYLNILDRPILMVQGGRFDYGRLLAAASPRLGNGYLLAAAELVRNDGPWARPDDYEKLNVVLRYTAGTLTSGYSITGMAYDAKWNSTDQIPQRAIADGRLPRFGLVDDTDGGDSHRYSISADWQRGASDRLTQINGYLIDYGMNLFSNFTYFLEDPENGDQFEQLDDRLVTGVSGSHRWLAGRAGRTENLAGLALRHDDIDRVGLYRTVRRERLATIREDAVGQTTFSGFFQNSTQWASTVRSVVGLRGDLYEFDVESDLDANSGRSDEAVISPKASLIFGPWKNTELYVNGGWGFHSNDGRGATQTLDPASGEAAERVDPLVRTKGAEAGFRSAPSGRFHVSGGFWGLEMDSELLFVGDAGTTEASRPSRRTGFEVSTHYSIRRGLLLEIDAAYARARFTDDDPAGRRIPGAVEGTASIGLSFDNTGRYSGSIRYRYLGPRPLVEDNSVRSASSGLVSLRLGWSITPHLRVELDVFNLLDEDASDIDYFYESRLPGEPLDGIADIHTHPVEPRSFRMALARRF